MYIPKLIGLMVEYYSNLPYVEHALKVFSYAFSIAAQEGIEGDDLLTLQCAAVLHDIGIPNAIKVHGSSKGPYQEKEGALLVPGFLEKAGWPGDITDKGVWLVGSHHTYSKAGDDILLQILMEADFLVNMSESADKYHPKDVKEKFFKTKTGNDFLTYLFLDGEENGNQE